MPPVLGQGVENRGCVPPVHPFLQMEPAEAEAARASLLSQPPWPRRLCQLHTGMELASAGQPEVMLPSDTMGDICGPLRGT